MLFMNVTQVIADIILTVVLCIILGDHKTGFKRYGSFTSGKEDEQLTLFSAQIRWSMR